MTFFVSPQNSLDPHGDGYVEDTLDAVQVRRALVRLRQFREKSTDGKGFSGEVQALVVAYLDVIIQQLEGHSRLDVITWNEMQQHAFTEVFPANMGFFKNLEAAVADYRNTILTESHYAKFLQESPLITTQSITLDTYSELKDKLETAFRDEYIPEHPMDFINAAEEIRKYEGFMTVTALNYAQTKSTALLQPQHENIVFKPSQIPHLVEGVQRARAHLQYVPSSPLPEILCDLHNQFLDKLSRQLTQHQKRLYGAEYKDYVTIIQAHMVGGVLGLTDLSDKTLSAVTTKLEQDVKSSAFYGFLARQGIEMRSAGYYLIDKENYDQSFRKFCEQENRGHPESPLCADEEIAQFDKALRVLKINQAARQSEKIMEHVHQHLSQQDRSY